MRALGLTCGIGSMLVGARQAGFDVIGNIEWRTYYHKADAEGRNTFKENFRGAFMKKKVEDLTHDDLERIMGVELALGHPECGSYSTMNGTNAWRGDKAPKVTDPGDIPLFTKLVAKIQPRFFVMDDLPKSFCAYSMKDYHDALPGYDLFPEWISNYNYGNIQKHRRRMFMIGALRGEGFAFIPGEFDHSRTVEDEIGDLPIEMEPGYRGNVANHDPHTLDEPSGRGLHMRGLWDRPTWRDMRDWFAAAKIGETFRYHSPKGGIKNKPGWYKAKWDGPAPVIDGGSGHMHPHRNLPFTIRERARIQGFPDDFIFYGLRKNADGTWCHERNIDLIKQTGKAMPIQFCRYASRLVRAAILKEELPEATNRRVIPANELVSDAKRWYCESVGYSDQEKACASCWLFSSCTIRSRRYGIGNPVRMTEPLAQRGEALAHDDPTRAGSGMTATAEVSRFDPERAPSSAGDSIPAGRPEASPTEARAELVPAASTRGQTPREKMVKPPVSALTEGPTKTNVKRQPREPAPKPKGPPPRPAPIYTTHFKKGVSNL